LSGDKFSLLQKSLLSRCCVCDICVQQRRETHSPLALIFRPPPHRTSQNKTHRARELRRTHTCSPAHISTYKTAFSALKSWGLKVVWRGGSGTSAAQKKPGRYFSSSFMCGGLHTKSFPILVPTLIFSRAKNVSSPTSRRHTLFPSISWSRLLLFAAHTHNFFFGIFFVYARGGAIPRPHPICILFRTSSRARRSSSF
jgi:hypothetical protein